MAIETETEVAFRVKKTGICAMTRSEANGVLHRRRLSFREMGNSLRCHSHTLLHPLSLMLHPRLSRTGNCRVEVFARREDHFERTCRVRPRNAITLADPTGPASRLRLLFYLRSECSIPMSIPTESFIYRYYVRLPDAYVE